MQEILKSGSYLGITKRSLNCEGVLITDTVYGKNDVFAAHSHENLYIAYVLEGNYIEENDHETRRCLPGSVVFHRVHEKHSNTSFAPKSRVLNVEIRSDWFNGYSVSSEAIEKHVNNNSFELKLILSKLYKESLINDHLTPLAVSSGMLRAVSDVIYSGSHGTGNIPEWVKKTKEILHYGEPVNLNLSYLSKETGVHPAHISRDFSRYFICSMSEYVRKLKIEKAAAYLISGGHTLAEISYKCGFSDQSHFTRIFKDIKGITPMAYKEMLLN